MDAILFDWDGTLVDSLGPLYRANLAVMRAFGLPYDEATHRATYQPDWRRMYGRLGVADDRLDEANELWHAAYADGAEGALFRGTADALDRLAATGVRLGLVTAGERSVVAPQIHRLGLDGRFEAAVFGDDLPVHKPDPAPLRAALAVLGLADRADLLAAGAHEVADSVTGWVDRAIGIMLVDRSPRAPAV